MRVRRICLMWVLATQFAGIATRREAGQRLAHTWRAHVRLGRRTREAEVRRWHDAGLEPDAVLPLGARGRRRPRLRLRRQAGCPNQDVARQMAEELVYRCARRTTVRRHSPLTGGTLIPTSTALLFPESEGTHAKLSSLYFTKVFDGNMCCRQVASTWSTCTARIRSRAGKASTAS